ncbi:hypothetical protein FIBSPDRAFT_1045981 [Athelia psychrophila]|uniref:Uncharacterized protein n=1 Tax=Athelia psychrophila TaxID=1759441 RepID=A0A166HB86_9AGAM|nr:hypothetical protein FIBSPDRAFT_1045981 [Fibularhizoctonia sp. CBS 109695]
MPAICDHIQADRIFVQPRNPFTRVCKIMRWRRTESIPWPEIPGQLVDEWFKEPQWELEDPLWRAGMNLERSIFVEDLQQAADQGLLNLDFETCYMFHTAFIHGHAHWQPFPWPPSQLDPSAADRQFYGSVQPAVFDGSKIWSAEVRDLVEKCLIRIAPVMKAYGATAPTL